MPEALPAFPSPPQQGSCGTTWTCTQRDRETLRVASWGYCGQDLPSVQWRREAFGSSGNHRTSELNGASDITKCPWVTYRDTEAQDGWELVEVLYTVVGSGLNRLPFVTIK